MQSIRKAVAASLLTFTLAAGTLVAQDKPGGNRQDRPQGGGQQSRPQQNRPDNNNNRPQQNQNRPQNRPQQNNRPHPGGGGRPGGGGHNSNWRPSRPPGGGGYVGHSNWRRGYRMAPGDWGRGMVITDYGRYHLRRPPYGYQWRYIDGNYVLAAMATGIISSIIMAAAAQ